MSGRDWIVYCLATVEQPIQTYIGATVNAERRLKQHNGILAGGAKYTHSRPDQWYRVCYVQGFKESRPALSFEWHWKHFTKVYRKEKRLSPLERREKALTHCLRWAEQTGLSGLEVVFE
jgi:structure-specific endonuclease subunit SLX1